MLSRFGVVAIRAVGVTVGGLGALVLDDTTVYVRVAPGVSVAPGV